MADMRSSTPSTLLKWLKSSFGLFQEISSKQYCVLRLAPSIIVVCSNSDVERCIGVNMWQVVQSMKHFPVENSSDWKISSLGFHEKFRYVVRIWENGEIYSKCFPILAFHVFLWKRPTICEEAFQQCLSIVGFTRKAELLAVTITFGYAKGIHLSVGV